MASTGIPLKDVLRFQVQQAYGQGIYPPEEIDEEISLREKLMEAIQNKAEIEQAKQDYAQHYRSMITSLPESQQAGLGNIDTLVKRQADQLTAAYSSPQMQSLLFYDPALDIEQLDIPVLVLFGGKDTQVTESLNRKPLEEAMNQTAANVEIKTFPSANHLFQKATTGSVLEYQLLDKEFVAGFTEYISKWINEN
jgi:pimeloyl-ACP methyl ester carboxylesterase